MDINWQKHGTEALSYLKGIGNKVKQVALQLTEIEVKVEDATNNEPWGPHGKDMAGEPTLTVETCQSGQYGRTH